MRRYVRDSYGEVLEILKYIDKSYTYKLPTQLIKYLQENVSKDYVEHINPKYPLYTQNLEENTKTLLALFNIKYWAKDKHKERLIKIYNINNRKESIE